MRVGIVRTDLGNGVYIADVESRVQRCFSHEPPGQSRNVRRPSDAELLSALNTHAILSLVGTDNNASVDTSVNHHLLIKNPTSGAFVSIAVTAVNPTLKTVIRDDLNAGFATNNLPYIASIYGGINRIQINTVAPNSGPSAILSTDTFAHGSLLNTPLGLADGVALSGLTLTALKTAVYPTAVTINVSSAQIIGLSTFASLTTAQKAALTLAIADLVAPQFVETPLAVMSFAKGVISKMRVAAFKPDGLVAGIAAAVVEEDGVTVYSYPP